MKKIFFYFFSLLFLFFIVILFDFIISNSFLRYKDCYDHKKNFYSLQKNCEGKYRFKKSFPIVNIITDELGLRVGKNKKPKVSSNKNIFIFGDSFTYGVGLEYEKTYVGLIEKQLPNYNVYNLAVGSYSPSVHLYRLKNFLDKKIIPQKILLFLDLTDIIDESERWIYKKNTNEIRLTYDHLSYNSKNKDNFIKKNFKILNNVASYINYNLRNFRQKINLENNKKIKTSIQGSFTYTKKENLDSRFWKKNSFSKGISLIEDSLIEISRLSKKNDTEFYLVIYPWAETLEYGQKEYNWSEFARNICLKIDCKLIDLIPEFQKFKDINKNWLTELYFLNDEHFNESGANFLYKNIIRYLN